MSEPKTAFYAEVMFLRFGDGTRTGPTITLQLAEHQGLDHFRHAKGTRYMMALAEITDSEDDVKPPADAMPPAPALPKGGRLARQAGIMCADKAFQRQVEQDHQDDWFQASRLESDRAVIAAEVIRRVCEIDSRAQLDSDAAAAEKFIHCFYRAWRDAEAGITP